MMGPIFSDSVSSTINRLLAKSKPLWSETRKLELRSQQIRLWYNCGIIRLVNPLPCSRINDNGLIITRIHAVCEIEIFRIHLRIDLFET